MTLRLLTVTSCNITFLALLVTHFQELEMETGKLLYEGSPPKVSEFPVAVGIMQDLRECIKFVTE